LLQRVPGLGVKQENWCFQKLEGEKLHTVEAGGFKAEKKKGRTVPLSTFQLKGGSLCSPPRKKRPNVLSPAKFRGTMVKGTPLRADGLGSNRNCPQPGGGWAKKPGVKKLQTNAGGENGKNRETFTFYNGVALEKSKWEIRGLEVGKHGWEKKRQIAKPYWGKALQVLNKL